MKMTNKELLEIALQQSAYDCNSKAEDYLSTVIIMIVILSRALSQKHIYIKTQYTQNASGIFILPQIWENKFISPIRI